MKKALFIIGCYFGRTILGQIIFLATKSRLLANWGGMAVAGYFAGKLIISYFDYEDDDMITMAAALAIGWSGILKFLFSPESYIILAAAMMAIIYPAFSYAVINFTKKQSL